MYVCILRSFLSPLNLFPSFLTPSLSSDLQDFLQLGPLTNTLRQSGAFFLRRKFSDADPLENELYMTVFNEYMQRLLRDGNTVEFFIEGTRSRSGKQLSPKTGLLRAALDPFFEGQLKDVYLVPVNITYEKPLEVALYKDEQMGSNKFKETLTNLFKASKVRACPIPQYNTNDFSKKSQYSVVRAFSERNVSILRASVLPCLLFLVLFFVSFRWFTHLR
jgi:hypothetical protein